MNRIASLLSFTLLLATAGCGGGPDDAPDLAPVQGTVMLDGKPAANLTVEFHPDSSAGTSGPMSTGLTSADGKFILSTSTGRSGAVIGQHKVVIKCPWRLEGRKPTTTADGFGSSADGSAPPPSEDKGAPCTLDIKFESTDTTPLSAEVTAEGVEDILLQATSGK